MSTCGKAIRLARVMDPASGTALIGAASHGILMGPSPGLSTNDELRANIASFAAGGATSLILTAGYLRMFGDLLLGPGKPVPILSLSWSSFWRGQNLLGQETPSHTLIATVEDAVKLGADMVHLYIHMGARDSEFDAAEMRRLGEVVNAAERFGMPVLCEPLARGPSIQPGTSNRKDYVSLIARMAAEAGADMVKVEYTGDVQSFSEVVQTCAVPVVMMGGAKSNRFIDFLTVLEDAMHAGAKGIAVGRNLFLHANPTLATRAVRRVVCEGKSAEAAAEELESALAKESLQHA